MCEPVWGLFYFIGLFAFSHTNNTMSQISLLNKITLSDPMDCSLPGSSVRGILQARVLEWGVIAFSTKEYYPSIKQNKIMSFAATWMDLGIIYWLIILN